MKFTEQELASEEWREVDGFPGYEVSSLGRARSWRRSASSPRLLSWIPNSTGYVQVSVSADGRERKQLIHVLVATAFHGPCPEGTEAAHDDGDKQNNRAGNIAWKTHVENCADRVRHGTQRTGFDHHSAKYTRHIVPFVSWLRDAHGVRVIDIAEWFGVTIGTAYRWVNLNNQKEAA